jgi:hypothetical protein
LFCSPSFEDLQETYKMAQFFAKKSSIGKELPPEIIIIPSQIDNSELAFISKFRDQFLQTFKNIIPNSISVEELWEARIPFVSYYKQVKKPIVNISGADEVLGELLSNSLLSSYKSVATLIAKHYHNKIQSKANEVIDGSEIAFDQFNKLRLTMTESANIFISYAKEDTETIRLLYQKLKDIGFVPWLDEENLLPGVNWRDEIETNIEKSDFVLVCLSKKSINKQGFVQKEVVYALDVAQSMPEGKIFIIPVRLEECDIPRRLGKIQWVDLYLPGGYGKLEMAIRSDIRKRHQP